MAEKSLNIDSNSSKKGIDVSKYYKHIVKTFLSSLGVLFFGLLFFFLIIRMMPISPYSLSEGNPIYDYEVSRLALDKNIIIQFFILLLNLLLGFWGFSYHVSGEDISIYNYMGLNESFILPYHFSLELIFTSIVISLIFGLYFGYLVSIFKNKKKGRIIQLLIILLWAIPIAGFGYLFHYIFGYYGLGWLPGCSSYSSIINLQDNEYITNFPLIDCFLSGKCFWDRFLYLITPVSSLNLIMIPIITYITYKLIEHYKLSREIPNFTGKLGFLYNFIVTSSFFIGPVVCTWDLTFIFYGGISRDFNRLILSLYLFLITFFILNLIFNILICGITLYLEHREVYKEKISLDEEKSVNKNDNSVTNEDTTLETHPKKNKIQRKQSVRIIIATVLISLLVLITFLLLIKYFIIYLSILAIIIYIPRISKKWSLKLTTNKKNESKNSINDHQPSNEEKPAIIYNEFSKPLIIGGCLFIIISILGIAIYGWEASGKNIFKTQTTLIIGISASLISIIGVIFGFLSAYYGKWVKNVIDNLILIFISIPCICILSIIIDIIGIADFNIIWIIGLISIPYVAHFSEKRISNEMKENSVKPALANEKNQSNKFNNIIRNLIFPIAGVLCLNIGLSIILFEGYNTMYFGDFLDSSFICLGRDIRITQWDLFRTHDLFALFIPVFLLFLIVYSFLLLGFGLYDYKLKKQ